jgi:hypothetical protein
MEPPAATTRLIRRSVGVAVAVAVSGAAWVALGAGSTGSAAAAATTTAAPGNLYVVEAESGRAVKTGEATWRLRLRDTSVLWFTDRPIRRSGFQGIARFVDAWPAIFRGAPPNAALLLPTRPADASPIAVELTHPRYNRRSGGASFTLRPEAATTHDMGAWLARLEPTGKTRTGRIVLFIDDGGGPLVPPVDPLSPAVAIAVAVADGQAAIEQLQALAFSSDPQVAAQANASLEQLAADADAGTPAAPAGPAGPPPPPAP